MKRRQFIASLAALGGAVAWPRAPRAQPYQEVRRVGFIFTQASSDPVAKDRIAVLTRSLEDLGWREGENLRIEARFAAGDVDQARALANELAAQRPDVVITNAPLPIKAIRQITHAIPIVFAMMSDPVSMGVLKSLSHPEDNITGFTSFEYSLVGKWIQLLKEIAPGVNRVGLMFDPDALLDNGAYWLRPFNEATALAAELAVPMPVHNVSEMQVAVAALGARQNSGLLVATDTFTSAHHAQIASLAFQHRIPGCYAFRYYATDGGLMSYGPDPRDVLRRAASYVDRILRGEKVVDLPVQQPDKFELVINLRTAKALELPVPRALLVRADEVIE